MKEHEYQCPFKNVSVALKLRYLDFELFCVGSEENSTSNIGTTGQTSNGADISKFVSDGSF